ncbi:ATP-dependent RNA helicase CsdA [Longilinea arvoryzae]|uniref:RNA helicase n=1 Tax=Longilinea arvoryzae TaxID=360412 RepID=A0A0S7BDV4_9CHLR|nr:DEAD/DEAH box helicase [Longilinea arvoryzae]GAP13056.1 ATP-dependent RNA helicase CsdA [Longilinea arvoryzae]
MTSEFTQFDLQPELLQAVLEAGFEAPMPIQSAVIPVMLAGQDVIGQAQTGSGKTAAYALPMLQSLLPGPKGIQGLVLVPTRELALQVSEVFNSFGRDLKARVLAVYGGQSYGLQIPALRRGVDIVVGTPGRIMDLMEREELRLEGVRTVVLDEADEMLSMGFIEDIEKILATTPTERQTTLFSATLPPEIRRLAEQFQNDPQTINIRSEQVTVSTVEQRYYLVHNCDKLAALTRLFEMEDVSGALVFVRTRAETGDLASELTNRGFSAEALNGDLSQDARERTLARFRQKKVNVLVATDVAARGLDIDDLSHVFNFDLPDENELYVHRIGRTGRAGKSGVAISIIAPNERRQLRQIEAFARVKITRAELPTEEDIRRGREEKLMGQVSTWLKRGRCLHERELVEGLVAEGQDPVAIAAAALKIARAEEKQRPIDPISEVVELPREHSYGRDRSSGRERPFGRGARRDDRALEHDRSGNRQNRYADRGALVSTVSHEPGMVRLSLNLGREQGIRVNDIVGAIASSADIPGKVIGKISIGDQRSLVDIPEELVTQVISKTRAATFHRQPLDLQRINN